MELSKEEKAWVRKVERLLAKCPERIGFYTVGDPNLGLYDKSKEHLFDQEKDMVTELDDHDACLGQIHFPSNVHGVCG